MKTLLTAVAVVAAASTAFAAPPADHDLLAPFEGVAPVDQAESVVVISEDEANARFVIQDAGKTKVIATAYLISPTAEAEEYVTTGAGDFDFGDEDEFDADKAKTLFYVNSEASKRKRYPNGTRVIECYQMYGRKVVFVGKIAAVPYRGTFRIAFASQDRTAGSQKNMSQLELLYSVCIRIAGDMDEFSDRSLRVKPDGTLIPHTVDLKLELDEEIIRAAGKAAEYSLNK